MMTMTIGVGDVEIEGPIHRFLFTTERAKNHPAEIMLELKGQFDSMPETRASIGTGDMVTKAHTFRPEMALMLGSWRMPDRFVNGGQKHERWINPNYIHKEKYADVAIKCDCGAVMYRAEYNDERKVDIEFDHTSACTTAMRKRAAARIWERRADIIRQSLRLGVYGQPILDRLAYDYTSIGPIARAMNIDVEALKEEYRERRSYTAVKLRTDGYSLEEISEIYNVGAKTLRRSINEYTPVSAHELYNLERKGEL